MATTYHLAVDARPLAGTPSGFTTYLESIIVPLLKAKWEVTLLTNRTLRTDYGFVRDCRQEVFGPTAAWRWEQVALLAKLRRSRADVYFAPTNRAIPLRSVAPTRTVLALLDVIPLKFPRYYLSASRFHFVRRELAAELSSVARADALITISASSAADIERYFRRQATPLLIRLPERPVESARKQDQFVYIGGVDPRKRIDNLIRAFARFAADHRDFKLVLIGRGYERFLPLCSELGITAQVELTGFVDDHDKMRLIAQSRALVYPSLYEGYGLAIAESLQAGTAVIAGRGGAQAEIGGDAALYITPT
ncbi:MAG TPA: glycosyltransferase family 1 protein, partial [Candidatus Saccharimonadales bacterium]|nr:glycosyltransferase family 1 protein [Candidatus Saccharimonadales bacterium]